MKAKTSVIVTALAIAGCAGPMKIINGNPSSVTVKHVGSQEAATQMAVQHCAQYGKDTRLIHSEGFIMSFDCIARQ